MSLRQAAHYFEIPFKTLHDQRGHKSRVGAGKPVVLSRKENREIATSCLILQELGLTLLER
jgi:hypothetical protein